MKILITGNPEKDLCSAIVPRLERMGIKPHCISRSNGYDFSKNSNEVIRRILSIVDDFDVFINLYANFFFQSSVLLHKVYQRWAESSDASSKQIINVGSTTDRVKKGKTNLYHYEKIALKEMSQGLSLVGVWNQGPKVTHLSIGTLENRAQDNPGRKVLSLDQAASYIEWILSQPKEIHINELSVDPIQ